MITAPPLRTTPAVYLRQLLARGAILALLLLSAGCTTSSNRAPAQITGRVVDIMGNPIAGCTVTPTAMETRGWDRIIASFTNTRTWRPRPLPPTQTDNDGRFACDRSDSQICDDYTHIVVAKNGFVQGNSGYQDVGRKCTIILRPTGAELVYRLSQAGNDTYLMKILTSSDIELTRDYFPNLAELRPHLLRVLAKTSKNTDQDEATNRSAAAVGHKAAILLSLCCLPVDTPVIEEWCRGAGPHYSVTTALPLPQSIEDYPSEANPLDRNGYLVTPWDLLARTEDDRRRLYHYAYAFPAGATTGAAYGRLVIEKDENGCRILFEEELVTFPCYH